MILYADILFAINFSMDFLSLFLCSIFLHLRVRKPNIIVASFVGAFYSILQMLVNLNGILTVFFSAFFAVIMIIIAFPQKKLRQIVLQSAMYIFVSCVLGGVMSLLYSLMNSVLSSFISNYSYESAYEAGRLWIIISLTAIISVVFSRILTSKKEVKTAEIKVLIKETKYELTGLTDSGNLLKDPLSGKSVILVNEESELGKRIIKIEDIYKKYIPYRDVSGEGILKGVIPDEIFINEVQVTAVVATVKTNGFGGYDALIPNALI